MGLAAVFDIVIDVAFAAAIDRKMLLLKYFSLPLLEEKSRLFKDTRPV